MDALSRGLPLEGQIGEEPQRAPPTRRGLMQAGVAAAGGALLGVLATPGSAAAQIARPTLADHEVRIAELEASVVELLLKTPELRITAATATFANMANLVATEFGAEWRVANTLEAFGILVTQAGHSWTGHVWTGGATYYSNDTQRRSLYLGSFTGNPFAGSSSGFIINLNEFGPMIYTGSDNLALRVLAVRR